MTVRLFITQGVAVYGSRADRTVEYVECDGVRKDISIHFRLENFLYNGVLALKPAKEFADQILDGFVIRNQVALVPLIKLLRNAFDYSANYAPIEPNQMGIWISAEDRDRAVQLLRDNGITIY